MGINIGQQVSVRWVLVCLGFVLGSCFCFEASLREVSSIARQEAYLKADVES